MNALWSCCFATSFSIDRFYTAKTLGFRAPMRNSMDAVSDRDFVLDLYLTPLLQWCTLVD